jgi:hypothetical protein
LRHLVPYGIASRYVESRSRATGLRRRLIPVAHYSRYDNVYQCAIHKGGSQWLLSILSDPVVFRYSGLTHYLPSRRAGRPLRATGYGTPPEGEAPRRSIVGPLYVGYPAFRAMNKPESYRAVFVMRDPRDLLVSWLFSTRNAHIVPRGSKLEEVREELRGRTTEEGLIYGIGFWESDGRYEALRSWADPDDDRVLVLRYEDLVSSDSHDWFARLFDFFDIAIPDERLAGLVDSFSFSRLAGRASGTEKADSHLRKGLPGDWRNHFSAEVERRFEAVTGDLVGILGYPKV